MSQSCPRCKITDFLTLDIKNTKKSLTFQANCRNSSPSKLLGGRITGVGRQGRKEGGNDDFSSQYFEGEGDVIMRVVRVVQSHSSHQAYFTATAVFSKKI